jgi:16S rRNA (uracil1498-N3)-methyltransferase
MSSPRIYIEGEIRTGIPVELPEAAAHHITRVLRLNAGDSITLFNGEAGEYPGTIEIVTKKQTSVLPGQFIDEPRTSSLSIELGICILKKDAMDRVVTKAVELGVTAITPIVSDHCAVSRKLIAKRASHWRQVSIAACEQCGLNILPRLRESSPTSEWIERQSSDLKLVSTQGQNPIKPSGESVSSVSLLVGPEGGFSSSELEDAEKHGFAAVTFGSRILRAETAPIVAISVLQHIWGDY